MYIKIPSKIQGNKRGEDNAERYKDKNEMEEEQYRDFIERLREIFNKEQEELGLWKLSSSYIEDVRSRMREH